MTDEPDATRHRPSDPVDDPTPDLAAEPVHSEAARSETTDAKPAPSVDPDASRRERRKQKKAVRKAQPPRKAPWWELPALVILAVIIAILVKTFIVQPFYIPSASMEHTLHGSNGQHDRILVNKPIYDFRDPHPGDIVVFNAPSGWSEPGTSRPPSNPILRTVRGFGQLIGFVPPDGEVLVKRVIAVGGQTVKGDNLGHVMVSNHGPKGPYRTLKEPYVYIVRAEGGLPDFGPVTIPKGRLWVMGDHRSNSADSRYHCNSAGEDTSNDTDCNPMSSTVPVGNVIGKAFIIAWPPSRWSTLGTPATFEHESLAVPAGVAPAVPSAVSLATVTPLFLVRRRRRRRPIRRRSRAATPRG
jgi:signal peptidase I